MNESPEFPGWNSPDQNWSKLPHELVNLLHVMKESELKVTLYILRHTWGFRNYDNYQVMTIDEIQDGRRIKGGGRLDNGTGLSKQSVITAIKAGVARGTLEELSNKKDKARIRKSYRLRGREEVSPGSKIWTSGVKNLDLEHYKDNVKRQKDPQPPVGNGTAKRKPTNRATFNAQMEQEFHKMSGIGLPVRKTEANRRSAGKRWNVPLWNMYDLFRPEEERQGEAPRQYVDDSLKKTLALIRMAIEASQELTIDSPASIEKVATSIHAKQFSNVATGDDDFWSQYDHV